MNTRDFGKLGEKYAARYLEDGGCHIIGMNVFVRHCEIDIIADDGITLIFAEVKTRRQYPGAQSGFGTPAEAVDLRKQDCLIRAAEEYLLTNPTDRFTRIDVIEVYADPTQDDFIPLGLNHIRNAVKKTGKFSRTAQKNHD